MDDMNEPPRRYEHELLKRDVAAERSELVAIVERLRADMSTQLGAMKNDLAELKLDFAKRETRLVIIIFVTLISVSGLGFAGLGFWISLLLS